MDSNLLIFFIFVTYLWFGEAEAYCTNVNKVIYGELGKNVTLSCEIPRDCAEGKWLHTNTSTWMSKEIQAQNHGYLVYNYYRDNHIDNVLHIYNMSIDRTGYYSCICQTKNPAKVYVEKLCINFKIGYPCQMIFYRNGVQNVSIYITLLRCGWVRSPRSSLKNTELWKITPTLFMIYIWSKEQSM